MKNLILVGIGIFIGHTFKSGYTIKIIKKKTLDEQFQEYMEEKNKKVKKEDGSAENSI